MMIKLERNKPSSIGSFVGKKDLLILGDGTVKILKSIDGENFYPMKSSSGEVELRGDVVIYNDKIENDNGKVRYQLELISGTNVTWGIV